MSACVLWQGRIASNGYGTLGKKLAHRIALERKLGRPISAGMDACHTCDVRGCVNEDHLYEGSRKQNMADCTERGRHNKPRGEKHWCARLTDAQVAEIRARHANGEMQKSLAADFNINAATVSRIVRNLWRAAA